MSVVRRARCCMYVCASFCGFPANPYANGACAWDTSFGALIPSTTASRSPVMGLRHAKVAMAVFSSPTRSVSYTGEYRLSSRKSRSPRYVLVSRHRTVLWSTWSFRNAESAAMRSRSVNRTRGRYPFRSRMQDLPRRNRLTRTETKPFHLSGRTRGSASCSQGAGGQAKHLGREIVTQPNVRDLDDVQEPARKDVGLLLSHVLPRWCVVPVTHGLSLRLHTDPGSANLGEERGRVQSRLERVTFRPIGLDNDIKILNRDTDLPWEGPRGLRERESRSRRCIRRVERVALEQGLSTSSGMRAKPFAVWVIAGGLVFAAIVTFAGAVLYLIQNGAGDGVFYSYLIFAIVPLVFAVFAWREKRWAYIAAAVVCILFLILDVAFSFNSLLNPADNAFALLAALVPTVAVGRMVTWINLDRTAHTVTSTVAGQFDSGSVSTGQTWTGTFTQTGTYHYYCTYHPMMTGTIIVQ